MSFLHTEFTEIDGHFSPDMRWIAYTSDESGRNEVYVLGFSKDSLQTSLITGNKEMISKDGGYGPRWSKDGKELYYRTPNGKVMVVEIYPGMQFNKNEPKVLFSPPPDISEMAVLFAQPTWDVGPDGNKFLIPVPVEDKSDESFNVMVNWTYLLDQ